MDTPNSKRSQKLVLGWIITSQLEFYYPGFAGKLAVVAIILYIEIAYYLESGRSVSPNRSNFAN